MLPEHVSLEPFSLLVERDQRRSIVRISSERYDFKNLELRPGICMPSLSIDKVYPVES